MDALPAFLLAAASLAGSPGPATLSLAATGAAFGARRALAYLAGIVAGMIAIMGVCAAGLIGAVLAVPGVAPVAAALAIAYMVYLAWRIATAAPVSAADDPGPRPGFAGGLLLSLLNPKAYAAVTALFSGFVLVEGAPLADALAKTAAMTAVAGVAFAAWLTLGAAVTRRLRRPRLHRAVNLGFALMLLAAVAFALLQ